MSVAEYDEAAPQSADNAASEDVESTVKSAKLLSEDTDEMSPAPLWRSRLSWRITLTVFITIMLVETAILVFSVRSFENEQLDKLREVGRSAIAPLIDREAEGWLSPPIAEDAAKNLVSTTDVEGIAVYSTDKTLITAFGASTIMNLVNGDDKAGDSYRSIDGNHYETIYDSYDLGRPYVVVARIDSSHIQPMVLQHIADTVWIVLLMSGFVTCILMIALGQWLLEPILLLRNNLLNAAKNPEAPEIREPKSDTRDEIDIAIKIANDLIRQNANNLVRLRTQAEDKIRRLAYYDNLTNLPNRTYFVEKLDEAIKKQVGGENKRLAVMVIDIDHFKDINDTMGHEIGDKLLEAIGQRLSNATPDKAIVARASADEFAVMTTLEGGVSDSAKVVERIFAALGEPVSVLQECFQIKVSIGVSHCPDDGMESGQILKSADIALNRAKEEGRDTVRYYSEDFDRAVQMRFQLLRDLRVALDTEQLLLYYHPQFDLKSGNLIGAEALIRWWRPDESKQGGSFIPPGDFIPVAEQSGLIVPIGEWVLKTACRSNKAWQEQGLPPFRIAVNLSGVQFHRGDIVSLVAQTLAETGLEPHWLELEVTESIFMEDIDQTIEILNQLHALGVEIAVDDFGTGYSSLSYLRQFPIDRLKIDQSFTRNALINPDDMTITRTIINLGHSLGLKVIAEGVETTDHEDFLLEHACDEVQGFKYSKPVPADKLLDFVQSYRGNLQNPYK